MERQGNYPRWCLNPCLRGNLLPAREPKTKRVPGQNLGDWIIFRVHFRVSSRGTYLQSRVRDGQDRDGGSAASIKRKRNKRARFKAGVERVSRADAASCNVTESGAVFVFRCSYSPRVSLCSHFCIHRLSCCPSISQHRHRNDVRRHLCPLRGGCKAIPEMLSQSRLIIAGKFQYMITERIAREFIAQFWLRILNIFFIFLICFLTSVKLANVHELKREKENIVNLFLLN